MNAEQLNSARLARWSQNGEARLTLEAAAEWLDTIGFCPYLPALTGSAPAPSFLEAVVGRPAQNPSAGERSRAHQLLARMVENVAAIPLKLENSLGEQPDFLASPEALRYVYALRGDRNFKAGPSTVGNDKVTPLALHCWQAIQEKGPLDIAALQPILGRDITEAAIARALQELWLGLYAFPNPSANGQPAKWELMSSRFPAQVAAGACTGQAESQSAMVSLYLHAVVAAAEEAVLAFLSPLAPQSKLREVLRGLGSMRQLDIIDIAGRAHVCLQGGLLPEMVLQLSQEQLGIPAAAAADITASTQDAAGAFEGGIEIERQPSGAHSDNGEAGKFVPKKFAPRKFVPKDSRAAGKRWNAQPGVERSGPAASVRFAGSRSRDDSPSPPRSFAASAAGTASSKRHDLKGAGFIRPGSDDRKPSPRGPGERTRRWEKSGEGVRGRGVGDRPFERKPFRASGFKPAGFQSPRSGQAAKPWVSKTSRPAGDGAKPWTKRASFGTAAPRGSDAEERPRRWTKPGERSGTPASGYKKPYAAKSSGFIPRAPKPGGFQQRPAKGPRSAAVGTKPFAERAAGRKPSGFTASGFKSAGAKSADIRAGGAKPWVSKGAESRVGSAKSYKARSSRPGEDAAPRRPRKPFGAGVGDKPWTKRASSATNAEDGPKRRQRPDGAAGANSGEKREAKPFWAKNPRGGKGSVAASRSNRPRGGKKAGGKKGGRKK